MGLFLKNGFLNSKVGAGKGEWILDLVQDDKGREGEEIFSC